MKKVIYEDRGIAFFLKMNDHKTEARKAAQIKNIVSYLTNKHGFHINAEILIGYENKDFIENKQTVRIEFPMLTISRNWDNFKGYNY